jgi:hypothetical protein
MPAEDIIDDEMMDTAPPLQLPAVSSAQDVEETAAILARVLTLQQMEEETVEARIVAYGTIDRSYQHAGGSVFDPNPDPQGSKTFCRIWICTVSA